jgi:hypothetical protein
MFNSIFNTYQQLSSEIKSRLRMVLFAFFTIIVLWYIANLHYQYQKNIGQINQLIQKKQNIDALLLKIPPKISSKNIEQSLQKYAIQKIQLKWENDLEIEVIGDFNNILQWLENTQFKIKYMDIKNQSSNQQTQVKFILI